MPISGKLAYVPSEHENSPAARDTCRSAQVAGVRPQVTLLLYPVMRVVRQVMPEQCQWCRQWFQAEAVIVDELFQFGAIIGRQVSTEVAL